MTNHHDNPFFKQSDYPLIKNVKYKNEDEYYKTKILAYKINAGALCKLVTAYNEPEKGKFVGSGDVKSFVTANSTDYYSFKNKSYLKLAENVLLEINTVVMFLKTWTETESLVLYGRKYYIVHDKNLEPIMDVNKIPKFWKEWIVQFNKTQSKEVIKLPKVIEEPIHDTAKQMAT